MSRDYRDKRGGHDSGRWFIKAGSDWVKFKKRQCRKDARAKAKDDLRHGREPQPRYRIERVYLD